MSELVEKGDTIQTKTFLGTSNFKITRVTKTLAISARKGDGYEYKFKRDISANMSHPHERWGLVQYKVIKLEKGA